MLLSYTLFYLVMWCLLPATLTSDYIAYTPPPNSQVQLFWRDSTSGTPLQNLGNLRRYVEQQGNTLLLGCNAGMYLPDSSPQGLYIEKGCLLRPLDTLSGTGNFYLKPNGVFWIDTQGRGYVHDTRTFQQLGVQPMYATQSGPMLVINGNIHPVFNSASQHFNIRNGVGINQRGEMVFVLSTHKVRLYDMAVYFKEVLHCNSALYLDGAISRMYCPTQEHYDSDGNFGAMVGVVK